VTTVERSAVRSLVVLAGALAVVLAAGCGGDDLAAHPDPPPSRADWVTTWAAGGLLLLVCAALLTWPAWARRSGSRMASIVLGLQAAGLWLAVALGLGVSVRAWQLSGSSPEELPAESLIELGRLGDQEFSRLLVLSAVFFIALPATVVTVAARFAGTDRVPERVAAAVVLAIQVGVWASLLLRSAATGQFDWLALLAAVNLPLTFSGAWSCWPREVVEPPGHRTHDAPTSEGPTGPQPGGAGNTVPGNTVPGSTLVEGAS
jgi:hypothetical protein